MKVPAITVFLISLILISIISTAAGRPEDGIRLYDEEMLLRDLRDKTGEPTEARKPLVQMDDTEKQTAIEVPRSIKYDTSLLEEGSKLFRSGKYRDAASAFETALKMYREEGFVEGEIALLGNLYLTYLELGREDKALEYLEAYHKKRRRK